jgi:hypothetical protein
MPEPGARLVGETVQVKGKKVPRATPILFSATKAPALKNFCCRRAGKPEMMS